MNWIKEADKNGEPTSLRAPDGTVVKIYADKNILITPDGYRLQIDIYPPGFLILGKLDNHDGKKIYDQIIIKFKEN